MQETRIPIDHETEEMMKVYALADHCLHCGSSGVFWFYRWGRFRMIVVKDGELKSQIVKKRC